MVVSCLAVGQTPDDHELRKGVIFEDSVNQRYRVKLGFRIQPLFTTNFRDFETLDDPDLVETSYQIRRARVKFDGYLGSPNWGYKLELALGNRNIGGVNEHTGLGARIILDAVVKYRFGDGRYSVWFGQTKLPGNRERVVSSQKMQFVDRHIVNSRFNLDRDIGVQVHGKESWFNSDWRWAAALSQGEGRNILDNNSGGMEYTARLEWLPFGEFKYKGDYIEADIYREETFKLSVGANYDFNHNAVRTRSNLGDWVVDDNGLYYYRDISTWMADIMAKYRGWSFLAEWADRHIADPMVYDDLGNFVNAYYSGSGWSAQLGYVFHSNWEVAGRFSVVHPDAGVDARGDYEQYTLGVSRYIYGHHIKLQSDISLTNFRTLGINDPLMFRFQMEIGI